MAGRPGRRQGVRRARNEQRLAEEEARVAQGAWCETRDAAIKYSGGGCPGRLRALPMGMTRRGGHGAMTSGKRGVMAVASGDVGGDGHAAAVDAVGNLAPS